MANLEREQPTSVKDDSKDPAVSQAQILYRKSREVRRTYEDAWDNITEKYNEGFEVTIEGERFRVSSKLLFQAHQRLVNKIKRPERKFLSDGLTDLELEVVRDAVNTVQEAGGIIAALGDDWGAWHKFLLLGDAFVLVGAGSSDEVPVEFKTTSLLNVYVDPFANSMNNSTNESTVQDLLMIFEKDYDQGVLDAERKGWNTKFNMGNIPVDEDTFDQRFDITQRQRDEQRPRKYQEAHYFNIKAEKPVYVIYGGTGPTILKKFEGDEYPFFMDGKPYIPVLNFKCFPSATGFYGWGIGHLLYDLAVVQGKLRNLALDHVQDNVNPINILTTSDKPGEFLNQLLVAREAQAMNEKSVIINSLNQAGQNTNTGSLSVLRTDPLTAEYERMQRDLETEVKRCGIPLDSIDRPVSETATATVAEAASATEFIQQIQEQNNPTYKDLDLMTISILKDTVPTDSEATIITKAELPTGERVNAPESPEGTKITLGEVVELLENNKVTVDVKSKSGAHKTPAERRFELNEAIQLAQGTKVAPQLLAEALRIRGFNFSAEDLVGEAQPETPEAPDQGQAAQLREIIQQTQPQ